MIFCIMSYDVQYVFAYVMKRELKYILRILENSIKEIFNQNITLDLYM